MPKAASELPRLLIGLMLLLAILMVLERLYLLRKSHSEESISDPDTINDTEIAPELATSEEGKFVRIGVFVTALFAYILTIEKLGYFIVTPLFLIGILGFLRSTKIHYAMIIAVGFTGFVYLLFVVFLNLPVPMGLLDMG